MKGRIPVALGRGERKRHCCSFHSRGPQILRQTTPGAIVVLLIVWCCYRKRGSVLRDFTRPCDILSIFQIGTPTTSSALAVPS